MTAVRSKRRVLPLIFIVKSFTKSLLIKRIVVLNTEVRSLINSKSSTSLQTKNPFNE